MWDMFKIQKHFPRGLFGMKPCPHNYTDGLKSDRRQREGEILSQTWVCVRISSWKSYILYPIGILFEKVAKFYYCPTLIEHLAGLEIKKSRVIILFLQGNLLPQITDLQNELLELQLTQDLNTTVDLSSFQHVFPFCPSLPPTVAVSLPLLKLTLAI